MLDKIIIKGARVHNLKNISVELPKNKLLVFTGISGSGKSSLAFDTIYAEGQRRYVESLSTYARQFLGVMDKPDVDSIEGLSPAISVDQKTTSHNPRSTVATITEVYDYLRLLFARIGHPHCPNCGREIEKQTVETIVSKSFTLLQTEMENKTKRDIRIMILSPVVAGRKGEFGKLFDNLRVKGFTKVRIDGSFYSLDEDFVLIKTNKHSIDVIVDRVSVSKHSFKNTKKELTTRFTQSLENAIALSQGQAIIAVVNDASFSFPDKPKNTTDHLFSERFACPWCNISLGDIEPRLFSFNSPHGACSDCNGIGITLKIDKDLVVNMNLSISEGAVIPFSKLILNDTWFGRLLAKVCAEIGLDMRKPLKFAQSDALTSLLHGTGDTVYEVTGPNRHGRQVTISETFPGILSDLERRFFETESDYVRKEIGKFLRNEICPGCLGKRLKKEALAVTIEKSSIVEITQKSIKEALNWLQEIESKLSVREKTIIALVLKEIRNRLLFLISVGLDYLTLNRSASSLAGGEAQRIRLASQLGTGLSGVLYVLDEPSIGLHQRDNIRLISTLKKLRDLGNTVIVVEHDKEMMENADVIFDFGPQAGENGGKIVGCGTYEEIKKNSNSLTGAYLSGRKRIIRQKEQLKIPKQNQQISLIGCSENNLKNINVTIPLNKLVCISGVSGSGKSTLVVDTIYQYLASHFNPYHREKIGKITSVEGIENIDRVILIDQSPIGRTPRSNPATYTGCFTYIRELFATTPDARQRGYKAGRFSFNVKGGRCEVCQGDGETKIAMQFMPDVYVTCDVCRGLRYNQETLAVKFKDHNIAQVLQMTVKEALSYFINIPGLYNKLETLNSVGLSYIRLGQPAPHLSGGEAQRVKLATELSKKGSRNTVYILDEPTTGLHFADLEKLLHVLHELVRLGNTVIVIEHNLDIIKNSDWIIDLGPEGGDNGGRILGMGTPDTIASIKSSYTGQFLKKLL